MGKFLGTGTISQHLKNYKTYKEASNYAKKNNIKTQKEWLNHTKSKNFPTDIPVMPYKVYKKEWQGIGHFLQTGSIKGSDRKFKSYDSAKKFAKKFNLKNLKEWKKITSNVDFPVNIPKWPPSAYGKKFKGWGDFLGTGTISTKFKKFKNFDEAKKIVKFLNIKTKKEWRKFCLSEKFPKDLPKAPEGTYKKKWKSWPDFLGTNKEKKVILDKKEDWDRFIKENELPKDFPRDPRNAYKKEGFSWGDFLGSGRIASHRRNTASYKRAKKFAVKLNLKR